MVSVAPQLTIKSVRYKLVCYFETPQTTSKYFLLQHNNCLPRIYELACFSWLRFVQIPNFNVRASWTSLAAALSLPHSYHARCRRRRRRRRRRPSLRRMWRLTMRTTEHTGDFDIGERCHSCRQIKAVEGDGEAEGLMEH